MTAPGGHEGEIAPRKARARAALRRPPPTHAPQFSWKKAGKSSRQVLLLRRAASPKLHAVTKRPTMFTARRRYHRTRSGKLIVDSAVFLISSAFAVRPRKSVYPQATTGDLGSGFDIVSGGELEHLGHIGIPGSRIGIFWSGKTREEIREALRYQGTNGVATRDYSAIQC